MCFVMNTGSLQRMTVQHECTVFVQFHRRRTGGLKGSRFKFDFWWSQDQPVYCYRISDGLSIVK